MILQNQEQSKQFDPIWLNVVKRKGYYIASKETISQYKEQCILSGNNWADFLSKNNLFLISHGDNNFKIITTNKKQCAK